MLAADQMEAPRQASGACLGLLEKLLDETGLKLSNATLFAADLGPGSFTGVKVAVTLAKTMAFAHGVQTVGIGSHALINSEGTAVVPLKRGEWFVRRLHDDIYAESELPDEEFLGYGPGIEPQTHPHAARIAPFLPELSPIAPELLAPLYLIEPSISTPKVPYARQGG